MLDVTSIWVGALAVIVTGWLLWLSYKVNLI